MKIQIPDVTLIALDCTDRIYGTINAINICCEEIEFGAVKLVSHRKPDYLPEHIQFEECPRIDNILAYNHYVFSEFGKHVQTSHCLMVQDHAFIINPWMWNNEWLEFDFLGAPWPIVENAYIANNGERARQGNGGFSIRSSYLMNLPKKMGWGLRQEQSFYNEDGNICCYWRKEMLENGIKYAPVEVAARFSYENPVPENQGIKTFGFHRNHRLGE